MGRLPGFDYKRPFYYMVTVKRAAGCGSAKQPPFSKIEQGRIEANAITRAFKEVVEHFHETWYCIEPIWCYVIMPDHLHLLIKMRDIDKRVSLAVVVRQLIKALEKSARSGGEWGLRSSPLQNRSGGEWELRSSPLQDRGGGEWELRNSPLQNRGGGEWELRSSPLQDRGGGEWGLRSSPLQDRSGGEWELRNSPLQDRGGGEWELRSSPLQDRGGGEWGARSSPLQDRGGGEWELRSSPLQNRSAGEWGLRNSSLQDRGGGEWGLRNSPLQNRSGVIGTAEQSLQRQQSSGDTAVLQTAALQPLFAFEWHDWIVKKKGQLDAFIRYIRENPARAWARRINRQYFSQVRRVVFAGREWFAYGNTALLELPVIEPFKCSRKWANGGPEWREAVARAERIGPGGAGAGTFMSPCEKACGNAIFNAGGAIIMLNPEGFGERWHPTRNKEALCAKGRMLFLSLYEPSAAKPDNATLYKRCHEMGDLILGAERQGQDSAERQRQDSAERQRQDSAERQRQDNETREFLASKTA